LSGSDGIGHSAPVLGRHTYLQQAEDRVPGTWIASFLPAIYIEVRHHFRAWSIVTLLPPQPVDADIADSGC